MKSQIKLGTVFGVELGLHYSWLVIAVLIMFSLVAQFHAVNRAWSHALVWSTAAITSVLFFACLFAHELSHAVVAKASGIPVHKITLFLLGGVAQIEKEASDASTEFWIALAGPVTSGVLGLILLALAWLLAWVPWEFGGYARNCSIGLARVHQSWPGCFQHDSGVSSRRREGAARHPLVGDG